MVVVFVVVVVEVVLVGGVVVVTFIISNSGINSSISSFKSLIFVNDIVFPFLGDFVEVFSVVGPVVCSVETVEDDVELLCESTATSL